jgi:hypothetical protein
MSRKLRFVISAYMIVSSICIGVLHNDLRDLKKQVNMHNEVLTIHNRFLQSIINAKNDTYTEVHNGKRMPAPKGS